MSLKRVKDAAFLSSLAHKDKKQIKQSLTFSDYELIEFIDVDFMQCYIAFDKTNQKDQVLVFRESTELEDWIANACFLPKETPYGIFHGEFFDILMESRREIMNYIDDKKFVTASFSQGASLGRMFTHIIRKREVLSNYNPFFVSFEPAMESKTPNYNTHGIWTSRGNDIVPIVPLALCGWNQSGSHIHLTGKNGNALINPRRYKLWEDRVSDTIMDFADGMNGEKVLLDHNIKRISGDWRKAKNQKKILDYCEREFNLK